MDSEMATQIKQGQRAVWDAGEFGRIAELILAVGEGVVEATSVGSSDTVLDVACGTGNATLPAARTGAAVTGLDLVPALLAEARASAEGEGLDVTWVEGDAEALPFEDASFDVVLSTFGCMFAPRHDVAAGEIARVVKPGGRIGICAWRPEGNIGKFFGIIGAHMPKPPPEVQPPPMWGSEDHVRELFEGTGVEPEFSREEVEWIFESPEQAVELYETKFGPMVMAKRALEPEGKWDALKDDVVGYFREVSEERDGKIAARAEYLRITGGKPA
jgi:SAM-dependent methyltransferase